MGNQTSQSSTQEENQKEISKNHNSSQQKVSSQNIKSQQLLPQNNSQQQNNSQSTSQQIALQYTQLYGDVKIVRNTINPNDFVAQQIRIFPLTQQQLITDFKKQIKNQESFQQNIPSIVQLVNFHENKQNAKEAEFVLDWEFFQTDLYQFIVDQFTNNIQIQEDVILQMISDVLQGITVLNQNGVPHNSVQPKNILVAVLDNNNQNSTQLQFKITNINLTGNKEQNHFKNMFNKSETDCFLSPEMFQLLGQANNQNIDEIIQNTLQYNLKSQIFSLGLSAMSMALKENLSTIYNLDNLTINFDVLQYKINEIRQYYSQEFSNIVQVMLNPDYNMRPTAEELQAAIYQLQQYYLQNPQHQADLQQQNKIGSPQQQTQGLNSSMNQTGRTNQGQKKGLSIQQPIHELEQYQEVIGMTQQQNNQQQQQPQQPQYQQQNNYQEPQLQIQSSNSKFLDSEGYQNTINPISNRRNSLLYSFRNDKSMSNKGVNDCLYAVEKMIQKALKKSDDIQKEYQNSQIKVLAEEIRNSTFIGDQNVNNSFNKMSPNKSNYNKQNSIQSNQNSIINQNNISSQNSTQTHQQMQFQQQQQQQQQLLQQQQKQQEEEEQEKLKKNTKKVINSQRNSKLNQSVKKQSAKNNTLANSVQSSGLKSKNTLKREISNSQVPSNSKITPKATINSNQLRKSNASDTVIKNEQKVSLLNLKYKTSGRITKLRKN